MKMKDLTNKRFGRLLVLFPTKERMGTSVRWKCQCDCGTTSYISSTRLTRGETKSCGCFRKEILRKCHQKNKGESGLNELFRNYKRDALRRKLKFILSKKYFKELTQQKCHYCYETPLYKMINIRKTASKESKEWSTYVYNGIDRKNNNVGYTLDNCVTCCKTCNLMKRAMPYEKFLEHIKKIYESMNLSQRY